MLSIYTTKYWQTGFQLRAGAPAKVEVRSNPRRRKGGEGAVHRRAAWAPTKAFAERDWSLKEVDFVRKTRIDEGAKGRRSPLDEHAYMATISQERQ